MIKRSEIEELINRCKDNDRKAQSLIYKSYYNRYFTLTMRYIGDHDLACEVVNQVFLKVFTRIDQLREPSVFEGWMKRICIHTCISEIRKRKKHLFQDIDDTPVGVLPQGINEGQSNMEMKELLELVMKLPAQMRAVFNLSIIDGFSHKEISDQLGISVGTSKFHLSQARQRLQQLIQEQLEYNTAE